MAHTAHTVHIQIIHTVHGRMEHMVIGRTLAMVDGQVVMPQELKKIIVTLIKAETIILLIEDILSLGQS